MHLKLVPPPSPAPLPWWLDLLAYLALRFFMWRWKCNAERVGKIFEEARLEAELKRLRLIVGGKL